MPTLAWISPTDPPDAFPPIEQALDEPDGLLAVGGDLSPDRLLAAYRRGIFPWSSTGEPILWWSPDPRAVLPPQALHVSRSLRRCLRRGRYEVSFDCDFAAVIRGCAAPRRGQDSGTWITPALGRAFGRLHELGHAHSVEVWHEGTLVGGLYGLALGRAFFAESMFSRQPDASKVALVHLARFLLRHDFEVIDCQVASAHLMRLGCKLIPRARFVASLTGLCWGPGPGARWPQDRIRPPG